MDGREHCTLDVAVTLLIPCQSCCSGTDLNSRAWWRAYTLQRKDNGAISFSCHLGSPLHSPSCWFCDHQPPLATWLAWTCLYICSCSIFLPYPLAVCSATGHVSWSSSCPELQCVCACCNDQGEHALVLQEGRYLTHCCKGTTGTGQSATFSAPVPGAQFLCIPCRYSCSSQRELSIKSIGYKAGSNMEKRML